MHNIKRKGVNTLNQNGLQSYTKIPKKGINAYIASIRSSVMVYLSVLFLRDTLIR